MRGGDSPRRESDGEMSDREVTECLRREAGNRKAEGDVAGRMTGRWLRKPEAMTDGEMTEHGGEGNWREGG